MTEDGGVLYVTGGNIPEASVKMMHRIYCRTVYMGGGRHYLPAIQHSLIANMWDLLARISFCYANLFSRYAVWIFLLYSTTEVPTVKK
jgi:hypothetical protein